MLQTFLPVFPDEFKLINKKLAVQKKEPLVFYFNGASMPIFQHSMDDYESFRLITSQFIVNGNCLQMDIVRCFEVSPISVKRWVKKYRESKTLGVFFQKKK